jgi:two-component system NtrC family sensor kinase
MTIREWVIHQGIQLDDRLRPRMRRINLRPRLTGLEGKLIVPYVLLTLVLAAIGIYIVTRLVTSTIRERFVNQIYEAARVASDAVVHRERAQLEDLRLIVFTQGVSQALASGDTASLQSLILPLAMNSDLDAVSVIGLDGLDLLTLGKDPQTGHYLQTSGTDFSGQAFVARALRGVPDARGDKFSGVLETNYGPGLFTSSPVYDDQGKLVGAILVGTRLNNLLGGIKSQALADLVLLDKERHTLATTLAPPQEGYGVLEAAADDLAEGDLSHTQDLILNERSFQITFTPFSPRDEQIGWMGVVLPSSYVVSAEATSRNVFSLLFTLGTVGVILIGFILSQSIARPILELRSVTQAVAAGELESHLSMQRSDEIGELADAFDVMTLRLRERTNEAARLYAEAVKRNRELAEINDQLRKTQMQLVQSEKLAAIGQLTAGIVHDVKNPLTVIKGMAELMLGEEDLPAEYKDELGMIRESAVKANNIISDLLKFARQSTPEMDEHDMRETVEAALRLTAYPLRQAHVQVIKDLPGEPVRMTYDDQQIEQVLVNLITNAIQAMPSNGVLHINLSQSGEAAAIAVQDNGTGISPENLNRIFDPFFTTKPEGEGTGLGLSVSYGIISNHAGRISVESKLGEGTTFMVLLPVHPGEEAKGGA